MKKGPAPKELLFELQPQAINLISCCVVEKMPLSTVLSVTSDQMQIALMTFDVVYF